MRINSSSFALYCGTVQEEHLVFGVIPDKRLPAVKQIDCDYNPLLVRVPCVCLKKTSVDGFILCV